MLTQNYYMFSKYTSIIHITLALISYTKYTVFNATWNFFFILILPQHVSASFGHHQVLLLKLSHCNFYIICSFNVRIYSFAWFLVLLCSLSAQVHLVFTILNIFKILCVYYKISKTSTLTKTFPIFPLGCPPLIRLCSMSFLPPGSSLCVSLSLWCGFPHRVIVPCEWMLSW
jgi:hypothetical protein